MWLIDRDPFRGFEKSKFLKGNNCVSVFLTKGYLMKVLFIALTDVAFRFVPAPAEKKIAGVVREWVRQQLASDEVYDSDGNPVDDETMVSAIMAYQTDKTMYLVEESCLGSEDFTTNYCDALRATALQNGWTLD